MKWFTLTFFACLSSEIACIRDNDVSRSSRSTYHSQTKHFTDALGSGNEVVNRMQTTVPDKLTTENYLLSILGSMDQILRPARLNYTLNKNGGSSRKTTASTGDATVQQNTNRIGNKQPVTFGTTRHTTLSSDAQSTPLKLSLNGSQLRKNAKHDRGFTKSSWKTRGCQFKNSIRKVDKSNAIVSNNTCEFTKVENKTSAKTEEKLQGRCGFYDCWNNGYPDFPGGGDYDSGCEFGTDYNYRGGLGNAPRGFRRSHDYGVYNGGSFGNGWFSRFGGGCAGVGEGGEDCGGGGRGGDGGGGGVYGGGGGGCWLCGGGGGCEFCSGGGGCGFCGDGGGDGGTGGGGDWECSGGSGGGVGVGGVGGGGGVESNGGGGGGGRGFFGGGGGGGFFCGGRGGIAGFGEGRIGGAFVPHYYGCGNGGAQPRWSRRSRLGGGGRKRLRRPNRGMSNKNGRSGLGNKFI